MPNTADETMRELLKAAVHFGHRSSKWNPKMKKYIYTKQHGIHIFDLQKTYTCLETACSFLRKASREGKVILFVSTKQQTVKIVSEAAKKCQMPYVTEKWMAGLLTNFPTIKTRIKYLKTLKEQEQSGELTKYTKKEISVLKKTIEKLELALGGVAELDRIPDVLFVIDTNRDHIAVKEAKKLNIPVVAILDSNSDPRMIDYPIPGNDDAIKSLEYLVNKISETIIYGKKNLK